MTLADTRSHLDSACFPPGPEQGASLERLSSPAALPSLNKPRLPPQSLASSSLSLSLSLSRSRSRSLFCAVTGGFKRGLLLGEWLSSSDRKKPRLECHGHMFCFGGQFRFSALNSSTSVPTLSVRPFMPPFMFLQPSVFSVTQHSLNSCPIVMDSPWPECERASCTSVTEFPVSPSDLARRRESGQIGWESNRSRSLLERSCFWVYILPASRIPRSLRTACYVPAGINAF